MTNWLEFDGKAGTSVTDVVCTVVVLLCAVLIGGGFALILDAVLS